MPKRNLTIKATALLLVLVVFILSACVTRNDAQPVTITLSAETLQLEVGEKAKLSAVASDGSSVMWIAGNSVVTVDEEGNVQAMYPGTASVLAIASGATAVCTVTVKAGGESADVFLPWTGITLKTGDSVTLPCVCEGKVFWASSNPDVAVVDDGVVSAMSAGIAKVVAQCGSASAECVVTVTEKGNTEAIVLEQSVVYLRMGERVALAENNSSFTWLSSDTSVVTVKDGVIVGVAAGSAVISVWTANASAECRVTVRDASDPTKDGYTLVWHDEFDGNNLDGSKWGFMPGVQDVYGNSTGPMFWGNNEQQYYTEDAVTVSDGTLKITAKRQDMPEGRRYSSARICTRNKGFWTYGYFEARIKLPAVKGLWPAFWMLPEPATSSNSDNKYGYWASSGEIDIMEARGRLANNLVTTLHYGNLGHSTYKTSSTNLSKPIDQWHVYALEWQADHMAWFVDGVCVFRIESSEWWSERATESATAPFDVDFYILLNLAVGGNFDGGTTPDADFTSAAMEVDYVRVYSENK